MLQEGYLHRSFQLHRLQFETVLVQYPESGRPGKVGGVVLIFPVINHCLSDDILMENDQKKKFHSQEHLFCLFKT